MKKEKIISVIIAIIILLFGQGIILKYLNSPRLYYNQLSPHRVGNLETHVFVLRNTGRKQLHNIILSIKSKTPIVAFRFDGPNVTDPEGDSLLLSGNRKDSAIKISFERILSKSTYSLTLQTLPDAEISFIATTDKTQAVENGDINLFDGIIILFGIMSIVISVLSGLVVYRKKNLVTKNTCKTRRLRDGIFFKKIITDANSSFNETLDLMGKLNDPKENTKKILDEFIRKKDTFFSKIQNLQGYADIIAEDGICLDKTNKEDQEDKRTT